VPKFKVGDRVERVGWLVPEYMRKGIVTDVIPNKQGQDSFNEYEVNFFLFAWGFLFREIAGEELILPDGFVFHTNTTTRMLAMTVAFASALAAQIARSIAVDRTEWVTWRKYRCGELDRGTALPRAICQASGLSL
jgi:hypothetical protein